MVIDNPKNGHKERKKGDAALSRYVNGLAEIKGA